MNEITELEDQAHSQDPRSSLAQWANKSDEWVRQTVLQILDSNGEIAADRRKLIYQLFLEEKGLEERTLPQEPPIVLSWQALDQPEPLYLTRLSNVRGVNALVSDSPIDFAPGLTLLFGENGTGKTGYARILKSVAGSRSVDEILPDINQEDDPPPPHAEIGYRIGEVQGSHQWTGGRSQFPFNLISVFDSPSVHLHLDADLDYTYRPASLALFDSVTREVQRIGNTIENEITALTLDKRDLLSRFDSRSSIYTLIESLGADSDLSKLQPLSKLPDDAMDRKADLEISIAGLTAGIVGQQIALQDGFQKVLTEALSYTSAVQNLKVKEHNLAIAKLSDLHKDQATLRDSLFAAADLPAPTDQTWEVFIRSGQDYRRHLEGLGVHDDTRCLYCRQSLGDDAVKLISRYGGYLESQIAGDIQEQQIAVKDLVKPLQDFSLASVQTYIENMDGDIDQSLRPPPDRLEALRSIAERYKGLQQKLANGLPIDEELPARMSDTRTAIESWFSDVDDTLKELRNQDSDREKSLKEKQTELIELNARLELSQSWVEIERSVSSAQRAKNFRDERVAITTILRNITNLSTQASELLTNKNFEQLFSTECVELRAPELKLEFFGKEGRAHRRRTLASEHSPSRVFSEGEQKILAIADFIAETRMSDNLVPVIFDDPVSSLDHRRVREVASRIADLASDHQVVVFTHDIFFATCLLALFEDEEADRCMYYLVTDDDGKGTVAHGTGPRWDTISELNKQVNASIENARNTTGEERNAYIRDGYGWLRSWCEVFVENDVLAQVTQRYQPYVRMTALNRIKLSVLEETIAVVTSVFEDACRYIEGHSQPLPTLGVVPNLSQLEDDWGKLRQCRSKYNNSPI